jgi:hypothetical protein
MGDLPLGYRFPILLHRASINNQSYPPDNQATHPNIISHFWGDLIAENMIAEMQPYERSDFMAGKIHRLIARFMNFLSILHELRGWTRPPGGSQKGIGRAV